MNAFADIPSKRIEPHSRVCASTVANILRLALLEGLPADNALASHLKAHHQLGARDRRIISETLFSVLRWWGWLKHLAPSRFATALENGAKYEENVETDEWFPCFAASWLLEGRPELPPSAQWWLSQSSIHQQDFPALPQRASIQERRHCLRPFFQDKRMPELTMEQLLPEWCKEEVECP